MASITQGPLSDPQENPPLPVSWSSGHLTTPWGVYTVTVEYQNQEGKIGLPLGKAPGSPGPTAVVVDLHAPYCVKIVEFTATRAGASPVLPSKNSPDTNLKLLSHDFAPHPPKLESDGVNYRYGGTGRYVYQCLTPVTEDTGFPLTFPPYEQTGDVTSLVPGDFDQTIVK